MRVTFRSSFLRDLRKLKDADVQSRIRTTIQALEVADSLSSVAALKKMRGADGFYRIRVGDYRIGLTLEDGTVDLVRVLHRRDIYRRFP